MVLQVMENTSTHALRDEEDKGDQEDPLQVSPQAPPQAPYDPPF